MTPTRLFHLTWGIWLLSWIVAAFWSSKATARSSAREGFTYGIPVFVGAWLLFAGTSRLLHAGRLWDVGYDGALTLAWLTIPCFLFAWWARVHLGDLWSAQVTRKDDHRVVDTGPYAIVRHPIYTGSHRRDVADRGGEGDRSGDRRRRADHARALAEGPA